jgi:hypothetical protein
MAGLEAAFAFGSVATIAFVFWAENFRSDVTRRLKKLEENQKYIFDWQAAVIARECEKRGIPSPPSRNGGGSLRGG